VKAVQDYLIYTRDEAKKRYDAGMSAMEACKDINFSDYDSWGDGERIIINVTTLYREFSGEEAEPDIPTLFGQMAELAKDRR